jgi:FkbM family methyltransferase
MASVVMFKNSIIQIIHGKIIKIIIMVWHVRSKRVIKKDVKNSVDTETDIGMQNLAKIVGDANFIIEAGSFEGTTARMMSTVFPKAEIHSFEPDLDLYFEARIRNLGFGNIKLNNSGIGSKKQIAKFNRSVGKHKGSGSFLKPSLIMDAHQEVEFDLVSNFETIIIRLDDYLSKFEHLRTIDLIWLDVQGFEMHALQGLGEYLTKARFVYLEVSYLEHYEGATTYQEILPYMLSSGFEVVREYLEVSKNPDGNVLFENVLNLS